MSEELSRKITPQLLRVVSRVVTGLIFCRFSAFYWQHTHGEGWSASRPTPSSSCA